MIFQRLLFQNTKYFYKPLLQNSKPVKVSEAEIENEGNNTKVEQSNTQVKDSHYFVDSEKEKGASDRIVPTNCERANTFFNCDRVHVD